MPESGSWSPPGIGRFWAKNLPLTQLIQLAFGIDKQQIAGSPAWLDSSLYSLEAKPEAGIALTREELRPRLQDLLTQRFHLVVHHEVRMVPGYFLVVAKHGSRLQEAAPGHTINFRADVSPGNLKGYNWTMPFCALMLTPKAGSPVVDRTGLTGNYDLSLQYAPELTSDTELPSLFTAIRDSLGLELNAAKVPSDTLVIDHVDRNPTEN